MGPEWISKTKIRIYILISSYSYPVVVASYLTRSLASNKLIGTLVSMFVQTLCFILVQVLCEFCYFHIGTQFF